MAATAIVEALSLAFGVGVLVWSIAAPSSINGLMPALDTRSGGAALASMEGGMPTLLERALSVDGRVDAALASIDDARSVAEASSGMTARLARLGTASSSMVGGNVGGGKRDNNE